MEGAPGVRADKATILIFVIILFHAVGLVGFFIPDMQPMFIKIVPLHLLLMLLILYLSHDQIDPKFLLFMLVIALAGHGIEWLGVHTHVIFGDYTYGDTLGIKWQDVPLIIAANWLMLVYGTGVFIQRLQTPVWVRVIIGAFIMMMLDVLIEPIAARYDYWHWRYHGAFLTGPLRNYASWFVVSAVMLGIFELFRFARQSNVGVALIITQFVFFILLYFA